ncbi:histidinol-phosphate transaminase [Corallibacter vietnamensis]|uniref:Histidinol-phosphate aminotransferase n=1 Tax=Corallibacter vietnamensis TaxID=904130 RepID=A0ABP7HCH3_9FLAO
MNALFDIDTLVRSNIKTIKPYASARDEYKDLRSDMMFLDANENPFENGVNRYPDPQQTALKQRLADIKKIPQSQILLGNGSDEVLDLIFRAFCEPNCDNIITLPPTYGMYSVLADINAVENIEVPLNSLDFQPKVDDVLRASNEQTKLLFLCSPNNPTANSFDASKIEKLISNFKGIVVIDEAYIDFSKNESWLNRINEFPNLIVTQTLSKAYGLAGIRLGVCYASVEIISVLNKIKPPYNVNELTQERALKQLNNLNEVKEQIQSLLESRKRIIEALKPISFIDKIYPSDANFILIKVDNATERYNQLIKKGIVVRNRTNQLGCENCLRITVGTKEENNKLIQALKSIA